MAKRKTKENSNRDIKGIILITIGALMLISIFYSSSSGIIGGYIRKLLIAVVGLGAFVFPFLFIFIGFCYIIKKGKLNFNKKFYGILFGAVNTLFLLQMSNMTDDDFNNSLINEINKIYNSSDIISGGILSYIIDIPLYKLFGRVGSYVIFVSMYVISYLLITKVSLSDIILKLHNKKITSQNKRNKNDIIQDDEVAEVKEKTIDEDENKESFIKNINKKIKVIDFIRSSSQEDDDDKLDIKLSSENEVAASDNSNDAKKNIDTAINEELNNEIAKTETEPVLEYQFPLTKLLNQNATSKLNKEDKKELISNANKLEETLSSFGVEAKVIQVTKGPSVTRFELQPNAGVKVSKIVNLADDIALSLAASGVRIEAPIPGKSAVGIEVPNRELAPVYLREVIESNEFINSNKNLAFSLGKDIGGNCVVTDLSKMPHLLIAGATGSGKSVCINTLIISLLYKYSPENVKLLMIDPKVVELSVYNGIPHLLIPVVTDPKKAAGALNWAVNEMTRRYKMFAENNVRNIESYNELFNKGKIQAKMPLVVMIIDELADLMMVCAKEIEDYIGRLAQMARAAGMHLVIATQRPSVDVITGVIKANIPSRISFAVSSQIDSRTILDTAGAEKLLGKGDMLFYPVGESKPIRIQGAFISEEEVEKVVSFIKNQEGEVEYKSEIIDEINTSSKSNFEEGDEDELIDEAIRIVVEMDRASTSLLQRKLRIGYNRAARIIEQLEDRGVISGKDGSKPRQILINRDEIE